jgi:hypothetical protein
MEEKIRVLDLRLENLTGSIFSWQIFLFSNMPLKKFPGRLKDRKAET